MQIETLFAPRMSRYIWPNAWHFLRPETSKTDLVKGSQAERVNGTTALSIVFRLMM
jgi:hypothetical protein